MGAWKSSDGGSITPLGASTIAGGYAGTTELVSAAVNTRGVIIRTLCLAAIGAMNGHIQVGGVMLLRVPAANTEKVMPYEVFVPAGRNIEAVATAGTITVGMTYDIF